MGIPRTSEKKPGLQKRHFGASEAFYVGRGSGLRMKNFRQGHSDTGHWDGNFPSVVRADLRAATLSSSNLILHALIQGRSPTKNLTTPSSLLDIFRNPWRFKDQSLVGLLSDVGGQLLNRIEMELEQRPLSQEGTRELKRKVESFGHSIYKQAMARESIVYGLRFLNTLGFKFDLQFLEKPRAFLLEIISMAEVGRKLSDWLEDGKRTEDERIVALAQIQILSEMIVEKQNEWKSLQEEEDAWWEVGPYMIASQIIDCLEKVKRNLQGLILFGTKEDKDFSGADLSEVKFFGIDLSGVNLEGAKINGAHISMKPLLSLDTGEWEGVATIAARIKSWASRGGYIDFREQDLRGVDLQGVDFERCVLSPSNLSRADLREASLVNTRPYNLNLEQANLQRANLEGTIFKDVRLSGANLKDANLAQADLRDTDLSGVKLEGANLEGALINCKSLVSLDTGDWKGEMTFNQKLDAWRSRGGRFTLKGEDLMDIDLSDADLRGLNFQATSFHEAKFKGADLRHANLQEIDYTPKELEGADLRHARLENSRFSYANLKGADLRHAHLKRAKFESTDLQGADLRYADLQKAELERANLRGANLDGANLGEAYLMDAEIDYKGLETLNTGEWRGISTLKERIIAWRKRSGRIDFSGKDFSGQNPFPLDLKYSDFSRINFPGGCLSLCDLWSSNFRGANLERASFRTADLSYVNFQGANLRGANLISATTYATDFEGADLRGAVASINSFWGLKTSSGRNIVEIINEWRERDGRIDSSNAKLEEINLSGVNLRRSNLRRVRFAGTNLSRANLSGADLSEADLIGTKLSKITFWNTKWEGAVINTAALQTLDSGLWKGLTMEEKKEIWKKRGGKIVDEGE